MQVSKLGSPANSKTPENELRSQAKSRNRFGLWRQFIRSGPVVIGAAVVLMIIILSAVFAPYVAPHDPTLTNLRARLTPPVYLPGGTITYPLGTDHLGRDILSRIVFGGRVSLLVGFGAMLVAAVIGVSLGLIAGFFGGRLDTIIMRVTDTFLAIPFLLLAMAAVVVLGSGILNLILILGLVRWTVYTRIVRGQVLSVRERQFVDAARAYGAPRRLIVIRHVLPNVFNPVIVLATIEVANMIIFESGLSFLGLGVDPTIPTWGSMLNDGRDYITTAWWLTTLPGLAILVTVVSLNLLGDWLRDVLDPRLRI